MTNRQRVISEKKRRLQIKFVRLRPRFQESRVGTCSDKRIGFTTRVRDKIEFRRKQRVFARANCIFARGITCRSFIYSKINYIEGQLTNCRV